MAGDVIDALTRGAMAPPVDVRAAEDSLMDDDSEELLLALPPTIEYPPCLPASADCGRWSAFPLAFSEDSAFKLDDTLGMAGGPALSSVAQVRIEARVSKTGEASPKTGDLRGESAIVAPGMSNVEVVIDKVLP